MDRNHRGPPIIMNEKYINKVCKKHGTTQHVLNSAGRYRCQKCRVLYTTNKRRKNKRKLIELFGGSCSKCGYNKCEAALTFHHLDPTIKDYSISSKGLSVSLEKLKKETTKCILICFNCHMESHWNSNNDP